MNGSVKQVEQLIKNMNEAKLSGNTGESKVCLPCVFPRKCRSLERVLVFAEVVIAPPALYLLSASKQVEAPIQVSAQNCHTAECGAFTGEIAPAQLKDASIPWVGDTHEFVAEKTKAAVEAGLKVILCIGETLDERKADKTDEVCQGQLKAVVDVLDKKAWT